MTHYFAADLTFICADPAHDTDDGFDAFTDAVTDELLNLTEFDPGIIDPDTTVRITDRWMSVFMGVEATSQQDAQRLFSANLRTALHAAGCITADWPLFKPTDSDPEVRKAEFAGA
ncbi:hypothetical protein BJF79_30755 [Actinomadura sp. CNU-125]|uniref:hypothetical protein n=1 Tax=Actinomadura sp. CNU-125 TaxID=1904961 RepID=UPI000964CFA5|nr:hypothetical protein [Actinomadura sp. CNU-125]OLT36753.1 hypothetical protein BJF79_30755 [Actinomadura sp. CNU-125]